MAQLTLDLAQFKSAGVYTLEVDDTVSYTVETNALRLLVGFSAKGPFNKPVFLRNEKDAKTVFGEINEKLEHKGSYFNRFAETLARRTPLFALNLLRVDEKVQGPDQVNFAAMSLDAGQPNPVVETYNKKKYGENDYTPLYTAQVYGNGQKSGIPYIGNAPFASMFDRTRFWEPSSENLLSTAALGLKTVDTVTFEHTNFLNFANVGTNEISLLVFKPESLSGYSMTCEEWYGGRESIPYGFIRPNDYVEDYFIQVVAVKGNWSNYEFLKSDTNWADMFDSNGIKKNKINSFISSAGVTLLGSWVGSIIPGFQNKTGEFVDIVEKINNNTTITGLLASFNKDAANILAFDYDGETDEEGETIIERGWFIDDDGDREHNEGESEAVGGKTFLIDMVGHNFMNGYTVPGDEETKRYGINFLSYVYDAADTEELTDLVKTAVYFKDCGVDGNGQGPVKADTKNMFVLADAEEAKKLAIGDLVKNDETDTTIIPGLTRIVKKTWVSLNNSEFELLNRKESAVVDVTSSTFSYKGVEYQYTGKAYYDADFGKLGFYMFTTIESVEIGSKTVVLDDNSEGLDVDGSELTLTLEDGIEPQGKTVETYSYVTKQHKISDGIVSKNLKFIPMKGLTITKRHMPGYDVNGNINAEAGVEKIYSMLQDESILRGLKNRQVVNFRYVIDSMSRGIAPMMGGKVYLSQLAKAKTKCTALLNAPSKKEFTRSANPYFCDTFVNGVDVKPAFNTSYIALGGNDEIYSENKFSLPDEDNGATFTGVFFPNLKYSVNGKEFSVPPAADVANVLVRKFTGSDPYMICANNNGVIANQYLNGVEFPLDDSDRDVLEPFGINPIITRDGNVMIYGNQTAYQRVKSDLNKLHIRENLNTLEIAVDAVLQNYVFLYNTPQTRSDITQKITPILQAAQTSGAIDTFSIQCDEGNNTEEIISADLGIVDVTLTMNHGMEKIVSRFQLKRNNTKQ